jgi:outer membrane protein OmpA-like peptidoglycan-associated protein
MRSGRTRYRVVPGQLLVAALAWSSASAMGAPRIAIAVQDRVTPTDEPSIASLDDYTAVKSITVYFDNGKSSVSRGQKAQLQQLAREAQGVRNYMIQVATYTPASGSEPDTQKLSMERASAVTVVLRQSGVPLAKLIVSAATDAGEQTAPDTSSKGHAGNSRTVITLLQDTAISGQ